MKNKFTIRGPRIALITPIRLGVFVCFLVSAQAEILDRIVAVVDGHIVTLSDVRQDQEVRARLGEKPVDDVITLAKELLDTYLIEQQMVDYPNIEVTEAEVDAELKRVNISYDSASDALRDAVRRRIRTQKFFDLKFRQLIRPTEDEISDYYEQVFLPEARTRGLQSIPPLADPDMTAAIRENVVQERLDHEVDAWLEAIRRRSNIEVFE